MAKISTLSLTELYERKPTPSVEKEILKKENFTEGCTQWCDKICKLKSKNYTKALPFFYHKQLPKNLDVLVVQDYRALPDAKWCKSGESIERGLRGIIEKIAYETLGKDISVGYTDLVKCQLGGPDLTKGKPPSLSILSKCKPYLWNEILTSKPKVIISLSTAATKVLVGKASNNGNRGEILRTDLGPEEIRGIPIVLTLHHRILTMLRQNSSGKFWGPDFYSVIKGDFEKACKLINKELSVPNLDAAIETAKKQITIARSLEEVEVLVGRLLELGETGAALSYDTETTGLDPYSPLAKIITAQFGFRNELGELESYVFPLWHRKNHWYDPDDAWELIREILLNPDIPKIGHNLKFDILYTFTCTGVRLVGDMLDTMLLLHQVNSGIQGCYGLKLAVWDWLPETELGGYEDKLPGLTKLKKVETEEEEGEVEIENCD